IVGKSKSLDFPTMLIFWSLVRNSVVLAVYLLFSVACFLTVHEHCLRVYIHASLEFREERVVQIYGEREISAEERILDKDRRRKLFYKKYTGRDWGLAGNYHMTLDSGELGLETCAGIIAGLVEEA
ncbi:MAG TPA: cytidylate kinase family protein, partial [Candidatus Pullilachnospira intestinigallinarum]|nr:cytidylate kinase family protein [Candidatus Pullilachnospira intestinigallinarum]